MNNTPVDRIIVLWDRETRSYSHGSIVAWVSGWVIGWHLVVEHGWIVIVRHDRVAHGRVCRRRRLVVVTWVDGGRLHDHEVGWWLVNICWGVLGRDLDRCRHSSWIVFRNGRWDLFGDWILYKEV